VRRTTTAQEGKAFALHAIRVAQLERKFDRNPGTVEAWIDASDARMAILAEAVGLQLDRSQDP